jgi:hypothetical protein
MRRNEIRENINTAGGGDGVVVKALRYYSDGPGIDSQWYHWTFQ